MSALVTGYLGLLSNSSSRYLEDLRKHMKSLKKVKPSATDRHGRKKEQKRIDTKRQHLKVLIKYLDKDYDAVKNRWVLTSRDDEMHVLR